MAIHKFFRLFSLTVASLFWASCSDSNPQFPAAPTANPDSSSDANESGSSEFSSSAVGSESSSSEFQQQSSSSEVPASGSSAVECSSSANSSSSSVSSSSESERYILAKDSSVTCVKESQMFPPSCLTWNECDEHKKYLGKDTSITEKILNKWEDALESCGAISEIPTVVYGIIPEACNPNAYYLGTVLKCSNDSTYRYYVLDGNLAYRDGQEYNEVNGISSSSTSQSSSSTEPLVQSCKQEEFVLFADILADVQKELYGKILSELLKNASLTDAQTSYLEKLLDSENKTLKGNFAPYRNENLEVKYASLDGYSKSWFNGYIAKTKTCADGTPVITERYKQKYDAILAECIGIIEKNIKTASADK